MDVEWVCCNEQTERLTDHRSGTGRDSYIRLRSLHLNCSPDHLDKNALPGTWLNKPILVTPYCSVTRITDEDGRPEVQLEGYEASTDK